VLSLAFSHYVLIQLFDLGSIAWLEYGGFTWLFGIPFLLIYLGARIYGRLLSIKSRFMSLKVVGGITATVAALIVVLPHPYVNNVLYFNFFVMGAAMIPIFGLSSGVLLRAIKKRVTSLYAKPIVWLYRYALMVGAGGFAATVALFVLGGLHGTALNIVTAVCGVPPQILLLYTGYSFKRETSR
jgi:hypothetical protein